MLNAIRPISIALFTVFSAIVLTGCEASIGTTSKIDVKKVETEITKGYEEQAAGSKVKSVKCPEEISSTKGTKATCVMTLEDGSTGDIDVKVTDDEGGIRWDVADPSE
jgi:hypothetical protein